MPSKYKIYPVNDEQFIEKNDTLDNECYLYICMMTYWTGIVIFWSVILGIAFFKTFYPEQQETVTFYIKSFGVGFAMILLILICFLYKTRHIFVEE